MKRLIAYSCMAIFAMGSMAQNQKDEAQMNRFISGLMEKMTLEEKVGQLSQCSGGFATGPDNTRISRTEDISKGLIGSLLNVSGAANTRKYQEAAMKSRLQIPLLFGLDVIHGYRTGFPLPLAEAASFDLDAIERGSSCAANSPIFIRSVFIEIRRSGHPPIRHIEYRKKSRTVQIAVRLFVRQSETKSRRANRRDLPVSGRLQVTGYRTYLSLWKGFAERILNSRRNREPPPREAYPNFMTSSMPMSL